MDYYGLLEIDREATDEDIKKAYRKLALKYHPKRNPDGDASERFALICEAYDVLSSPKWKTLYDHFGQDGIYAGVPVPPVDNEPEGPIEVYTFHGDPYKVFRDFFGVDSPFADFLVPNLDPSYIFFETPAKPVPGPDQEHVLHLSLEDAYYGCVKTVKLPLRVVDETGTKTVDVEKSFTFRVPKGTRNGHFFYFNGAGTSGPNVLPGHVIFRAEVQPHPEFRLEDTNFVTSKTLYLGHALTGCMIDVTTFDGKTVHIPIADVIKPGHRITLKGEGMPIIGFAAKGDLLIEFEVTFPEKLSKHQKDLIREALIKRI